MGAHSMTQEQFNQLKDVDQAKRLTKDERVKGKTKTPRKLQRTRSAR